MVGLRTPVALAILGGIGVVGSLFGGSGIFFVGWFLVPLSPTIWAVGQYRKRSSTGQRVGWTRKAITWYVIEAIVAVVYIVASSFFLLLASAWHAEGPRLVAAYSFFTVHYLGSIALLSWSLREWLHGSRKGYWLPLFILGLTGTVVIVSAVVGSALPGPPGL